MPKGREAGISFWWHFISFSSLLSCVFPSTEEKTEGRWQVDHSPSRTLSHQLLGGTQQLDEFGGHSLQNLGTGEMTRIREKLWDGQWSGRRSAARGPVSQESAVPGAGTGVSPETAGCSTEPLPVLPKASE